MARETKMSLTLAKNYTIEIGESLPLHAMNHQACNFALELLYI
jgi:hypothetical protein